MFANNQYIKNFKSGKKISEILHDAADKHLSVFYAPYVNGTALAEYSCIAVLYSIIGDSSGIDAYHENWETWKKHNPEYKRALKGLYNMGLRTTHGVGTIFDNMPIEERQQARYGWLKMAAMLAEEQEQRGEI